MSKTVKMLVGLAAALLAAWIYHGPIGAGEAFVARMEAEAKIVLADAEMQQVRVRFERSPLSRVAILSGDANDFQREGMGGLPGLNDLVGGVPGVAGTRWADAPGPGPRSTPLIAEALAMAAAAYAVGLLIGRLLFGRARRESYLGD